ncbi:cellulose binding domain-containing protein [Streptosporangium sp. NPDC048047]|uniref:cellulose binding domain-containing protein n=1 Tax=Streptosporangium sp. NPDC048047 TaxID=3155748 RepID=UPI00341BD847
MATRRIAPLLGVVSLGAAAALLAVSCAGRTADTRHAAGHTVGHTGEIRGTAGSPADTRNAAGHTAEPGSSAGTAAKTPDAAGTATASAAGCTATVTLVESWPGGYRGAATISNVSGRPMRDWYIQWLLPQGAKLTQAWNGMPMQSGPIAMIHAPEGAVLAPGATVSEVGFVGSAAAPPAFTEITCG